MGVATLITVMTLVQGANIYVEQKIANLGTNVFRIARTALRRHRFHGRRRRPSATRILDTDDMRAVARGLRALPVSWARRSTPRSSLRYQDREVRGRDPVRPHAQHGRYRHAHRRRGPLLHRARRPPRGARLPDRRPPGAASSSPASTRSGTRHPRRATRSSRSSERSRRSARCWARTRTISSSFR